MLWKVQPYRSCCMQRSIQSRLRKWGYLTEKRPPIENGERLACSLCRPTSEEWEAGRYPTYHKLSVGQIAIRQEGGVAPDTDSFPVKQPFHLLPEKARPKTALEAQLTRDYGYKVRIPRVSALIPKATAVRSGPLRRSC